MAARGAEATSLRAIADDVGIKKPSIMYHFPTKDALRMAVLEAQLMRWGEVLPRLIMATAHDGAGRFEALTKELIEFFSENPDRARLIFRELMDRPTEMKAYLRSYIQPWIQLIVEQVELGRERGTVREGVDPEAFVWVMVNCVMANVAVASSLTSNDPTPAIVDRQAYRLTDELVRMARSSLFHEQPENHVSTPEEKDSAKLL